MKSFNLIDYCLEKGVKYKFVSIWLLLKFRNKTILSNNLSNDEIVDLKIEIDKGIKCKFNFNSIPNKISNVVYLDQLIKEINDKTTDIDTSNLEFQKAQLKKIDDELNIIEENIFSRIKSSKLIGKDAYEELRIKKSMLIRERNDIQQEIKSLINKNRSLNEYGISGNNLIKARNTLYHGLSKSEKEIIESNKSLLGSEDIAVKAIVKNTSNSISSSFTDINKSDSHSKLKQIEVHWEDVRFGEGAIFFRYRSKFSFKYRTPKSHLSFNKVKELYLNRNLPKLVLIVEKNKLIQIENIEVLEFLFLFLENTGSEFKELDLKERFKSLSKFNKPFYLKHLSSLFNERCFDFLIKIADDELPIVPIAERVVNTNGSEIIHDSFLFPIKKKDRIIWIWESIEEKKATYIFKTMYKNYINEIQMVYDYLTSDFINKRLKLARKQIDQNQIPVIRRIKHDDFLTWQKNIEIELEII